MKRISSETIQQINHLSSQGFSLRKIGLKLGVSKDTVFRNLPPSGLVEKGKKLGRPRKLSKRLENRIRRDFESGKLKTPSQACSVILNKNEISVSQATIRRSLVRSGLKAYSKVKKPSLGSKHKKLRRKFCRTCRDLTPEDWQSVIFTDESKYNVHGPDGNKKVWRRSKCILLDHHVRKVTKFGGGSVMVWGCITYQGVGQLAFIDSKMNASLFVRVLDTCLSSTCNVLGLEMGSMVLQQDNDPKHTSKLARTYLADKGIRVLEWPSCSPDMNLIEHVWDDVDKRIRALPNQPSNTQEMKAAIEKMWYSTPIEYIRTLHDSMPRRIEALRRAKGGYTKY